MKKTLQRGFTLIELLVVIAIIGILAAVVLGSLNDARDNANDASAKTSINNVRNAAEIFYSENGFTYGEDDWTLPDGSGSAVLTDDGANGICNSTQVQALLTAARNQTNVEAVCVGNDESYAVQAELRSGRFFCVDSTGFSGETASSTIDISGSPESAANSSCN